MSIYNTLTTLGISLPPVAVPAALAPADTPPELALARQGRAGAVHYHLLRRNT